MSSKKTLAFIGILAISMLAYYPICAAAAQTAGTASAQAASTGSGANQSANQPRNVQGQYDDTVQQATLVFRDMMQAPERNIPPAVLEQTQAIMVVPNLVKAGFIAAGRHGTGVLLERHPNGWSPPIFVSISGGSIGAQLGVTSTDVVLVFNDRQNVQQILQGNNFTLGADASAAAGPSGAAAKASTQNAAVYSYKRTSGLFAGASVTGGVISLDQSATTAYYNINPNQASGYYGNQSKLMRDILNKEQVVGQVPQSAQQLQAVIDEYTQSSRKP